MLGISYAVDTVEKGKEREDGRVGYVAAETKKQNRSGACRGSENFFPPKRRSKKRRSAFSNRELVERWYFSICSAQRASAD